MTTSIKDEIGKFLPCIDGYCDSHGTTVDGSPDDPEPAQCQYCYQERFPLIDKLEQLFNSQLQAYKDELVSKIEAEKQSGMFNNPTLDKAINIIKGEI